MEGSRGGSLTLGGGATWMDGGQKGVLQAWGAWSQLRLCVWVRGEGGVRTRACVHI